MLTSASGGSAIVVCNTCRMSDEKRESDDGIRGGAQLRSALVAVKTGDARYDGIAIQEMPCLFACSQHCTVHLRAPGKVGYVLGGFAPDEDAARAILDFASSYVESDFGRVPFRQWPPGVKGHFITRIPPPDAVVSSG